MGGTLRSLHLLGDPESHQADLWCCQASERHLSCLHSIPTAPCSSLPLWLLVFLFYPDMLLPTLGTLLTMYTGLAEALGENIEREVAGRAQPLISSPLLIAQDWAEGSKGGSRCRSSPTVQRPITARDHCSIGVLASSTTQ
ncbi:unnamed protein product [Pleuronectes platessa]|uniref:Uncharacterized protein n=1 Tax=Pleuronectes platessa TaxID=8262 RepID=A0A9N7TND1_PLEPL|nr:unnamed protein product [Pleuronectes platessa]